LYFKKTKEKHVIVEKVPDVKELFGVFKDYNHGQVWEQSDVWLSRWRKWQENDRENK
jgi:hypothetical protein